jgi:hypothetical protein
VLQPASRQERLWVLLQQQRLTMHRLPADTIPIRPATDRLPSDRASLVDNRNANPGRSAARVFFDGPFSETSHSRA